MSHQRTNDEADRPEVERAVLAYLERHPDAADTLDGIVSWWLPQQRYEIERQRIEQALGHLVALGRLRCDRLPGGDVLYALNRSDPPAVH
ncbi:hypothetical protein SAMN05216570_3081 [Dyella sp. OK004]|uniref:hypothetical protein n=1 Tax=Dyella sp. OK004 TaxID=1855292 RepID=UPI0008E0A024|nr:hypothetical protein [Dyella sp. OK004]SFS14407.1 hypothetical protein SAMN05216570_3081 [Dyella sp. OK004]